MKISNATKDMQLTETAIMDLECFLDGLRRTVEDGSVAVSYGAREDAKGLVLTVWHDDDSEEYLFPDILTELFNWLEALPRKPPNEARDN